MIDTDADPPADPASTPRRRNWQPKVRWFGAEFLVVVTGVLVALALNAWWSGRQAEARETVYLRQLVADLSETERIMANRDSSMARKTHHSVNQLMISFGTMPRPPRDSVFAWMSDLEYTATPRPVLGTVEALVASGDFGAVRSDSLRAAILRYLDVTRERMMDQGLYLPLARADLQDLERLGWRRVAVYDASFDLREADILRPLTIADPDTSGRAASPDWQYPFSYDVMDIYESPEFLDVLTRYRMHVRELQRARSVMSESAAELREHVTRTIGA